MIQIQAFESIDPARLPPDLLTEYVEGRDTAWRIVIAGQAQSVFVLKTPGRAGVANGGDSTWIGLRADEGAEDAALIVLTQPDETERRA